MKIQSKEMNKLEKLRTQREMILYNGRFDKQFEIIDILGKGGFGTVLKVRDRLEEQIYAVKKVRLHLPFSDDLRRELKNHKVYREVLALASTHNSYELKHTVRYHSSWLEDLSANEVEEEKLKLLKYQRKRLSSVAESDELNSASVK